MKKSDIEKKCFLSGGTGFFGKSILAMLKRGFFSQYHFTILSRNPESFLGEHPEFVGMKQVNFVAGNVCNFPFLNERFDVILHCAAPTYGVPDNEVRRIIVEGTRHIVAFAKNNGVSRLLLTSSGAVYGPQPPDLSAFPEDFPCHPNNAYGIAKFEAEQICLTSGIPTVIARCFAFVGPYLNRDVHFAIGNFIRDCLVGNEIRISGDGMPYRSYLYADDLVEWLFAILADGKSGCVYNVGSDQTVSVLKLAKIVRNVLAANNRIIILQSAIHDAPPARYIPDISRIKKELGVNVCVPLSDAIRRSAISHGKCPTVLS